MKAFNPFCCFTFKRNYIKRDNSRKGGCPFWRGTVACKHEDVVAHLTIQARDENILKIEFTGDVNHDITKPKATKMVGERRATAIHEYEQSNATPSKYHRDKLVELPSESFQAGNRSGVGISHSTTRNIRAAAKRKTQFGENLLTAISYLQQSIAREDEQNAIDVGHMWRKLFGYIQHFNLTNNINLVLFNEASVRLYHEIAKYDTVYIDATGKLFSDEGLRNRGRLLYYAMVIRHPYAKYPPIPIVEYITSCHTTDSIRVMFRTLKEKHKEVFPNLPSYPTPALVMTDFSMAIINACIREFTNENVEDYLTRGFKIVNGDASREDAEKTIYHVCAAHILKLNKFHVKKLQEKGKQENSQVHIAMRFFGRLLCCSTLQEMTKFVSLGYYIFQSKYVCPTLNTKLDKFSEALHDFIDLIGIESDEDDFETETPDYDDDAERLSESLSSLKEENVWITFWNQRLSEMKKNEASHGKLNKYFMPKYFAFIFKNYLPSCVLWSRILLGDLTRFNEKYAARTALTVFNPKHRNYLRDNNTNGQVEDFFRLKKTCSFKGRRNMRVDTFVAENWKDNKGLQRQFVDGLLLSEGSGCSNSRSIDRVSLICGIDKPKRKSATSPVRDSSSSDDDISLSEPVEQWNKSSPQGKKKKKKLGKYLSPSETKLKFRPVAVKRTGSKGAEPKLDCGSKEFKEFERQISSDVAKRKHGFKNVKDEVKRLWRGMANEQKQKYYPSNARESASKPVNENCNETYLGRHCICRQNIQVGGNTVKCIFCQEIFHCCCVKFCPALANLRTTNYMCATCVDTHYAKFLEYVWSKEDATAIENHTLLQKLNNEFKLKDIDSVPTTMNVDLENMDSPTRETKTFTILHSVGIENKKSNCWINSILQCLFASPLYELILEMHTDYAGESKLLNGLYSCFQEMAKFPNEERNAPCVRFASGPLLVANAVGMQPRLNVHQDGNELLDKIFSELYSEINVIHKQSITSLVQWHILGLNRCLSSECNAIRGRSFMPWNLLIDIPVHSKTIGLTSLIKTLTFGRLSTEEDDVCHNCDSKAVTHYIELFHKIPDMAIMTIYRVKWDRYTRIKIKTPVSCDKRINFRATTTTNYDETDIVYSLFAAVLHYGSSAEIGSHFVSYIFHEDQTATLYDDTVVQQCNIEEILRSQAFLQNVYICFYIKGDRWPECENDSINYTERRSDVPWYLHECDVKQVNKVWNYQKKVVYSSITSFDLNTVKPLNWLNGDAINGFLMCLCQQSLNNGKDVYVFNSHLYDALKNTLSGNQLRNSSLAVDSLQYDILMFPINIASSHWALLVFYPKSEILCYYDSYHNIDMAAINSIVGFITTSYETHGLTVDLEKWLIIAPNKIPKQVDSCSCGVYTCMNAFYSINPHVQVHSAHDVDNIRYWIVHCLLTSPVASREKMKDKHAVTRHINYANLSMENVSIDLPGHRDTDVCNVFSLVAKVVDERRNFREKEQEKDLKTLINAGNWE